MFKHSSLFFRRISDEEKSFLTATTERRSASRRSVKCSTRCRGGPPGSVNARCRIHKTTFSPELTSRSNKLECLSQAVPFSLVLWNTLALGTRSQVPTKMKCCDWYSRCSNSRQKTGVNVKQLFLFVTNDSQN
jgi:hypothetical protein